ncbi:hypothetical protein ACWDSD_11260 [Streptomyces spiralis]
MPSPAHLDDRYDEPDQLRDQVRQLLTYRATITLAIAVGLLGGLLLALLRPDGYSATSDVLVRSRMDPAFGVSNDNQVLLGTERQMALSPAVAARAAGALGEPSRAGALSAGLRVTSPPNTQILRLEYTAPTAQWAARVSNAFAEAYLADRQERTQALVARMTSGLEEQTTELSERIAAKQREKNAAATAALQGQNEELQKRISDIRAFDTTGGDIIRRAEPPTRPSGPGPAALIGLGLLGGLLLGIAIAWLRSVLEPRARSVGEVQGALGAPVLGILPGPGKDGELLEVGRSGGDRAEAYRTLAFRLRHAGGGTAGGSLLVVAPGRGGDAEAVAVNLAAALAEAGDDVLLMDATAGTPGLSARLPLADGDLDDTGASSGAAEGRVVVDAGAAGRFTLLPDARGTGDDAPASAPLTDTLASAGSGGAALVVTRPVLESADALAVAPRVGGVLVVGGDRTRRDELKRVRELIGCSGGRILGAVLDIDTHRSPFLGASRPLPAATPTAAVRGAGELPAQHTEGTEQGEKLPQPQKSSPVQDDTVTASR